MEKKIEDLREMLKIQGRDGNWNFDSYMCGLYNGMELSLATLEGREGKFRTFPKKRKRKRIKGMVLAAGI